MSSLLVLYEDAHVVVVNKPAGLRSTPAFQAPADPLPEQRKRKRQERFSEVLESLGSSPPCVVGEEGEKEVEPQGFLGPSVDPLLHPHLQKLARESGSVPRKRGKFGSYARRSLRIDDEKVVGRLWDAIEGAVVSEEKREGMSLTDSALTRVRSLLDASSSRCAPTPTTGRAR